VETRLALPVNVQPCEAALKGELIGAGPGLLGVDGYTVSVYREPMIQSFADATTADLWEERNSKAARRVPRGLWPVVHRKLTMLDSAQQLEDLAAVPGNRLEALTGNRKGQHSIRVNQQYRITFRWEKHDAHDVCCEDYH